MEAKMKPKMPPEELSGGLWAGPGRALGGPWALRPMFERFWVPFWNSKIVKIGVEI